MENLESQQDQVDPISNHKTVINMSEDEFRQLVVRLFRDGRDRMDELQTLIDENTQLTKQSAASTADLVEIFNGAKTGASVFAWCGRNLRKAAVFLAPFITLGAALYAIAHGNWPKMGE